MGQTLADDAQTEEDKFLIDSKVGDVRSSMQDTDAKDGFSSTSRMVHLDEFRLNFSKGRRS